MDYRGADIQTSQPRISRAIVEQTEIGAAPRQRACQAESGRDEFASDSKSFGVRSNLKLGPGQPCAVDCSGQFAEITLSKHRRVEDVDRFVIEPFKNRACKIFVWINNEDDWAQVYQLAKYS